MQHNLYAKDFLWPQNNLLISFLLTLSFLLVMLQALEIAVSIMDYAKSEAHLIILSLITVLKLSEKYKK